MNRIPDENQFEQMLASIPPEPGARLDQHLSTAPWTPRGVARRRAITTVTIGFLTLALLAAITPQGRAFAQSILRFFVRTASDTRPVPTLALVTPDAPQETAAQLFDETHLPFEEACGDIYNARCSLSEINDMVTFPVKGLAATLEGLTFAGATGGPQQVMLVYTGENVNGALTITEEPASATNQPARQVAASATVETVLISGVTGEYVQGGWYSTSADNGVAWNPDPFVQTLGWEADSIHYTMIFRAWKKPGVRLDKPDMLYLAEQIAAKAVEAASPVPTPSGEMQGLTQQAGFAIIAPGWLPAEYTFLSAAYTPGQKTACLYYSYGSGNAPVLAVAERPAAGSILDDITVTTVDFDGKEIIIPAMTEPVSIPGADDGQAMLVSNGVNAGKLCPRQDFIANQALLWQSAGKNFVIFGLIDQYEGGVFISRIELQRMAESLTGVPIIPINGLDPQRLLSVESAGSLAGFAVKAPEQMVAGLHLEHAVYLKDAQTETVKLVYTPAGGPTRGGIDYGFFITQAIGSIHTLEEVYLWGGFEYISIHGQTALYRKICWDALSGGTDCRQELYWNENGIGYDLNAYLPGALEKDTFIAIAESMR